MSFIEELKRRNVFKVGIAYLVGGWLLLQFTEVLSELLNLPEAMGPIVVAVVAIGFPIAVFFAWAFELTPEGVKRESEVDRTQSITPQTGKKLNNTILVMMALAIVYLLYDKFSGPEPASTPVVETAEVGVQQNAEPATESESTRQSIAVLPFDNRSNREEDQFFTDGIHDDLLTTIAQIGSMKVISRTSVMEYKDTTKKIPEIAAELGVNNILEGGIQRSGNQVRINVQLIDAQTDEHLWAEIFDRELTAENLFAIQSEISKAIASALRTTLSPEEERRINTMPTQSLEAYNAYLRGKPLVATRNSANLQLAIGDFREAVNLDPDFALAWVGLADATALLSVYGTLPVQDTFETRQEAIDNALATDPGLGEAYTSLGSLRLDQGAQTEAEAAFRRAIELSPNYATAYHWYSNAIQPYLSRTQEQVDLIRKAVELDPRSAIISSNLASAYANQGMYSRAEQQFRKTIELNPGFSQAHFSLSQYYAFNNGRMDQGVVKAMEALRLDPGSPFIRALLVMYMTELGDLENAEMFRQQIANLSDDIWILGWADMMIANAKGSGGGIKEAWNWMRPRMPIIPFISEFSSLLLLANDNPEAARAIIVESSPGWIEPEKWGLLIDSNPTSACMFAWTLVQTGDAEMGQALLKQSLAYIEEMPAFVEHPDSWNIEACYLLAGNNEKALEIIESQLAHNHLFWWKTIHQLSMFEAVRHEPRYQAVRVEVDRRLAEQREAVTNMNLESGP